jgi:hypothetical protein
MHLDWPMTESGDNHRMHNWIPEIYTRVQQSHFFPGMIGRFSKSQLLHDREDVLSVL